jgi:hypothetical protein
MSPARQRVTLRLIRRDEPIKFSIALVVTRKLCSAGGSPSFSTAAVLAGSLKDRE